MRSARPPFEQRANFSRLALIHAIVNPYIPPLPLTHQSPGDQLSKRVFGSILLHLSVDPDGKEGEGSYGFPVGRNFANVTSSVTSSKTISTGISIVMSS